MLPLLFSSSSRAEPIILKRMHYLTLRLIARRSDIDFIITALCSVDGIESIRLVDDLLPQMGEESPATIARPADLHPTLHSIEIELADATQTASVRSAAESAARERGIEPEFIEDT
jgi:hypothetical protein